MGVRRLLRHQPRPQLESDKLFPEATHRQPPIMYELFKSYYSLSLVGIIPFGGDRRFVFFVDDVVLCSGFSNSPVLLILVLTSFVGGVRCFPL